MSKINKKKLKKVINKLVKANLQLENHVKELEDKCMVDEVSTWKTFIVEEDGEGGF